MKIKRWFVYLVDLEPRKGTKPGKVRPCLSVQPDHFSDLPSTLIIPFTTKLVDPIADYYPLRVRVNAGSAGLLKASDLLIDQMIATDNSFFLEELGSLTEDLEDEVRGAMKEFLDL